MLGSIGASFGGSKSSSSSRSTAPTYKPKIRDIKAMQKKWLDPAMWGDYGFQSGGAAGRDITAGQITEARQRLADTYRPYDSSLLSNEYLAKQAGLEEARIASANAARAASEGEGFARLGDITKTLIDARAKHGAMNRRQQGRASSFGYDVSASAGI
jgi:hypothetical protein